MTLALVLLVEIHSHLRDILFKWWVAAGQRLEADAPSEIDKDYYNVWDESGSEIYSAFLKHCL